MDALHFEIAVDSVPYIVDATPYKFNSETRFKVSFNGSKEYIFTWDSSLGRLAAIGEDSSGMPDSLEIEIAQRLQNAVQ